MNGAVRILRGLGALAVLLAVIVGVPVLLAALGLVPSGVPSVGDVVSTLGARDDGQLLRGALAAGVWVCWFIFTSATATELWALVSQRSAPRWAGLQLFQGSAAALLAAVVMGLSLPTSMAVPSATASDRPPLPVLTSAIEQLAPGVQDTGPSPSVRSAEPAVTGPRYEVQRRDTLWDLADRHLGDPLRYAEIVALNGDLIGPDNRIKAGMLLVFPDDAAGLTAPQLAADRAAVESSTQVVVEPGDSLWSIAAEVNGDGATWPSVWEANAGETEPGGEVFDDPDLIRPGWTLTVPSGSTPASSAPAGGGSVPTPPSAPPDSPEPAPPTTSSPTTPSTQARPSGTATATSSASSGSQTEEEQRADAGALLAAAATTTTVLGAVSLLALRRYRRRQFRHRRPGRSISAPPPQLVPVERALIAADGIDVVFLDRALRSLVRREQHPSLIPDVVAVSVSSEAVTVRLAEAAPNAHPPWEADAEGTHWRLRRDAALDDRLHEHGPAPFPGLVTVGRAPSGEQWLIDLERVGVLRVAGDTARADELLRYIAAELAHNSWSEMLRVDAVGLGAELAALNPDRLRLGDADAVASFATCLQHRSSAVDRGAPGALHARVHDVEPDAWAPRILLVGATECAAAAPMTIGKDGHRLGLAVAAATDADGVGMRVTIRPDGVLVLPELGLELQAHQLPADEATALAQLLAHVAALPEDDDGLDETAADGRPQVVEGLVDSVLPLPDEAYLATAATTSRDVQHLAPATTPDRRAEAAASDPQLDRDLAGWAEPHCRRPKLTLLGPVRVDAQGKLPERNPRRQFYTEVVAYLATRPDGATSEQYATALWPDEPDVIGKTKVRQSISVVRTWLGTNEDGEDYLPSGLTSAAGGRYRVTDALVDADLFRRLRSRGLARGADGIADLERALELVMGRPFELPDLRVRGVGGYGWLLDDGDRMDLELAAVIVDVAHVVATHHLGNGEPERSVAAAQVALRSGTFEDVPLLDLVAACDALGRRAEADAYVARILANHDAEVEEDLPPRTAEVLFRRSRN